MKLRTKIISKTSEGNDNMSRMKMLVTKEDFINEGIGREAIAYIVNEKTRYIKETGRTINVIVGDIADMAITYGWAIEPEVVLQGWNPPKYLARVREVRGQGTGMLTVLNSAQIEDLGFIDSDFRKVKSKDVIKECLEYKRA